MSEFPVLTDLALIVLAATLLVAATRRLRAPSIVAYILAGLLLGPITGLLHPTETLELVAESGIALLLFIVGLELSIEKIRDIGKVAVLAALGQMAFTAIGAFLISLSMGFGTMEAIFLATAVMFSSTVVAVKLLSQKGEMNHLYGRIAVGVLLVQDVVVIVVLTLVTGLGQPEEMSVGSILGGVGTAFGGMLVILLIALAAARYLLPRLLGWMAPSTEGLFIWSLAWCFLLIVAAEALSVSPEIGAFLAGVSLAQMPFNGELRRRVHPLMNFFVMVFFVTLGVHMELGAAAEHWLAAVLLTVFVLIGKPLIFLFILPRIGHGPHTSLLTGVTLAQISEFSFVFASVGLASGLIDQSILSLIGVVGLATIAVSVYMIRYAQQLYDWLDGRGWLKMAQRDEDAERPDGAGEEEEIEDHVIVVGINALGRRIVERLREEGETVIAVDVDTAKLEDLGCDIVHGNVEHASVLEAAGLDRARLLVSALQIEEANRVLAFRGREAGVPTAVHAFDEVVVEELRQLGTDHLILSKEAGTRRLLATLRERGVIDE